MQNDSVVISHSSKDNSYCPAQGNDATLEKVNGDEKSYHHLTQIAQSSASKWHDPYGHYSMYAHGSYPHPVPIPPYLPRSENCYAYINDPNILHRNGNYQNNKDMPNTVIPHPVAVYRSDNCNNDIVLSRQSNNFEYNHQNSGQKNKITENETNNNTEINLQKNKINQEMDAPSNIINNEKNEHCENYKASLDEPCISDNNSLNETANGKHIVANDATRPAAELVMCTQAGISLRTSEETPQKTPQLSAQPQRNVQNSASPICLASDISGNTQTYVHNYGLPMYPPNAYNYKNMYNYHPYNTHAQAMFYDPTYDRRNSSKQSTHHLITSAEQNQNQQMRPQYLPNAYAEPPHFSHNSYLPHLPYGFAPPASHPQGYYAPQTFPYPSYAHYVHAHQNCDVTLDSNKNEMNVNNDQKKCESDQSTIINSLSHDYSNDKITIKSDTSVTASGTSECGSDISTGRKSTTRYSKETSYKERLQSHSTLSSTSCCPLNSRRKVYNKNDKRRAIRTSRKASSTVLPRIYWSQKAGGGARKEGSSRFRVLYHCETTNARKEATFSTSTYKTKALAFEAAKRFAESLWGSCVIDNSVQNAVSTQKKSNQVDTNKDYIGLSNIGSIGKDSATEEYMGCSLY